MFPIFEMHLRHHTYKNGEPGCRKEVARGCEGTPHSLLTVISTAVQTQGALLDTYSRQHRTKIRLYLLASAASHCTSWATRSCEQPTNNLPIQHFQPVSRRCEQQCWTGEHSLRFTLRVRSEKLLSWQLALQFSHTSRHQFSNGHTSLRAGRSEQLGAHLRTNSAWCSLQTMVWFLASRRCFSN